MPNDIIPFGAGSEVPAHLQNLFGDDSNIAPRVSINQLSYRGKVWRRVVDGEETTMTKKDSDGETVPMQIVSVIVLDHNKGRSRAFYKGSYEEGKNAAPDCYSGDGITPDADVKEPCAATCATCPNSVKGSKITENQKQTTACSPFKRIAIVPAGKAAASHVPLLLRLAQTSVWDKDNAENEAQGWFAWDQYMDFLRARGAKHTASVVTKVKFDQAKAYPKLLFSAGAWASAEEAAAAKTRLTADREAIDKILKGGSADGVAGTAPAQEAEAAEDTASAAKAAIAEAEARAKAAALAKAQAEKIEKAAAKAKAEAEAKAAAAAVETGGDDWGDEPKATPAPEPAAKPAAKAAKPKAEPKPAPATEAIAETPAEISDLLAGWDD